MFSLNTLLIANTLEERNRYLMVALFVVQFNSATLDSIWEMLIVTFFIPLLPVIQSNI